MKRLQGMEPTSLYELRRSGPMEPGSLQTLPPEVILHIIKAGDLDEAIKNIVRLSQVNKKLNEMLNYNDFQGFTQIVHILANKFNMTPDDIAKQFKTPVAQEYSNLYGKLYFLVTHEQDTTKVKKLLDEGLVDINAGAIIYYAVIVRLASKMQIAPMIKLLLEYKANPYLKIHGQTQVQAALNKLNIRKTQTTPEDYEEAKALLEEAMKTNQ